MLASIVEDCIISKRFSEELTDVRGALRTQYLRTLWFNRLQEYRVGALKQDKANLSTGDGIKRFLTTIIRKIKPKGRAGVPYYDIIVNSLKLLVDALAFQPGL